jgi:small-conductance mechanosensitive channel
MENRIFSHMFGDLARDFGQPVMLWQAGILLATLAIAWLLARLLRRTLELRRQSRYQTLQFGAESLNRAAFPLIGAALVWLARAITGQFMHTSLLDLALVPLFGIGLIYIVFFFARRSLAGTARSIRGCSSSRRSSRRRSLRIGDTINVSGLQGMVTQIRTRYTVVRGLDGIETLIPNEKLITDVVQNQSSYLTRGLCEGGRAGRVRVRRRARDGLARPRRRGRAARAAGAGADAVSGELRPGRHQSRIGLLDRGRGNRDLGCALDREP